VIDPKKIEEWRAAYVRLAGTMAPSGDAARIIADAFPALLAEREEMLALLREIANEVKRCPRCGMSYCGVAEDHAPDCRIAAFLKEQ
jgi:hypothetical protein